VRLIVSNDRKYVTLAPPLAEPRRSAASASTRARRGRGHRAGDHRLPFIVIQRAETTVTIPTAAPLISGPDIMRDLKSGVLIFDSIPVSILHAQGRRASASGS
jgi:hypothetical protein